MLKLRIEVDPVPASRPRISGRRMYQPARNVEYREVIQCQARLAMKGAAPLLGALTVRVKLYRKSSPTARNYGDVDNHLKGILDALTGIVFADDAQIVQCVVTKHKEREKPRVEIEIGPAAAEC